jgi:hypothetical protein
MGKKIAYIANLSYSPQVNPLVEGSTVVVKKKHVRTGVGTDLVNTETGEITHRAMVHTIEDVDDAQFVKIFAAGVIASYELNRTAQRVFQCILDEYQKTPMSGGFADTLYLSWFDGGLSGRDIGMSEYTFKRGMNVLLEKGFIAPRMPNQYWVNPTLFFKGDRVLFLKEYRRKVSNEEKEKRSANITVEQH